MVARVTTVAFIGMEAKLVDVQVHITPGLVAFSVVGLPDKAVAESRERVRSALYASGLSLPAKRITVNLAPADLPKEGSHYDLPIALGLMAAMGAIPEDAVNNHVVVGELALDGSVSSVTGVLPCAVAANAHDMNLICPEACGPEAAWAGEEIDILAAPNLLALVNHFQGTQVLSRPKPAVHQDNLLQPDLRDVKGQETARRALEVAAAGGHNMLMVGPPGAGKSMLAMRLPSLLPPLMPQELLEISMIASIAGELPDGALSSARPFRSPHHSASMPSLVGGGLRAKPGEVSLAHHGVLFLDELPEFQPNVLDALRQPLESGEAIITRANYRVSYPAKFQLIAAMNPCRCGHFGEPGFSCRRGKNCNSEYQSRISGPFLDRMDLFIEVPAVTANDMLLPSPREGSVEVRTRVHAAREKQAERYQERGLKNVTLNAHAPQSVLEEVCACAQEASQLLYDAAEKMRLSARGLTRILRVSRTLADLEGSATVGRAHLAEALSYRLLHDRRAIAA